LELSGWPQAPAALSQEKAPVVIE